MSHGSGKAFIFSAPSGSGKTTIVRHLLENFPDLSFSISATTRKPRTGEVPDQDYYFLSKEVFEKKIAAAEFVEWEEVYNGLYYGTLKSEIERIWNSGCHVVFDVDVKGGVALKEYFGQTALAVFVKVANIEVLKQRLRERGTETEESFQKRIDKAEFELQFEDQFDVTIVNDSLEEALREAETVCRDFILNS